MKRWMKITAYIIVMGICTLMGLREFRVFQSWAGQWSYENSSGISIGMVEEMLEAAVEDEDMNDLVFWTQEKDQMVSIREPVKKETETNVILICGNPRLLIGNYNVPQTGDTKSCLVDGTTAYQLFGNTEVVGASIEYNGREYVICGVMETPESTMIIQMPAESEKVFTRVTAANNGINGDWNLKNVLWNKYQISVTEIRWDFLRGSVKFLFCLTVMAVYICLIRLFNQRQVSMKRSQILDWVYALAPVMIHLQSFIEEKKRRIYLAIEFAAGVLLLLVILETTGLTQIPVEYIPAKWSEFSFYKEAWNKWTEGMKGFLEMALSTLEIRWLMNCVSLGGWIILGGMTIVLGIRSLECHNDDH